jgi:chromosome transmission fidelity protein 1
LQSHHVGGELADADRPSRAPRYQAQFQVLEYGESGPGKGSLLCQRYTNAHTDVQLLELGQIVVNFARIVPGGMVVFLPSYRTLEKVKNLWDEKGLMNSIRNKKKARSTHLTWVLFLLSCQVFMESTADVHELLAQYAEEIRSSVSPPRLVHTIHN